MDTAIRVKPWTNHNHLDFEFCSMYSDGHASAIPRMYPNTEGGARSGCTRGCRFAVVEDRKTWAPVPDLCQIHSAFTQNKHRPQFLIQLARQRVRLRIYPSTVSVCVWVDKWTSRMELEFNANE